jgi:hypothetical protein
MKKIISGRKVPLNLEAHLKKANAYSKKLWKIGAVKVNDASSIKKKKIIKSSKTGKAKALIAETKGMRNCKNWIYYPLPQEAMKFAHGVKKLREFGPGEMYPGSVGYIFAYEKKDLNLKSKELIIEDVQGTFVRKLTPQISKSLASRHKNWREYLFREVFNYAKKKRFHFISFVPNLSLDSKLIQRQKMLFKMVAEEMGLTVVENKIVL